MYNTRLVLGERSTEPALSLLLSTSIPPCRFGFALYTAFFGKMQPHVCSFLPNVVLTGRQVLRWTWRFSTCTTSSPPKLLDLRALLTPCNAPQHLSRYAPPYCCRFCQGVCFDEQVVDCVPTEDTDVRLDFVLTPTRTFSLDGAA